ncbi:hypothetical protein AGMMS4952_03180 [Spirochaetia bacterium]|nr:hypothetical protein AGMMS4952_03180 [Spirochaetia bacterium]
MTIKISGFLLPVLIAASCASTGKITELPAWANDVEAVYPNARYIAQMGRGPDLQSAENDGVGRISQYITSQINSSSFSMQSITRVNGENESESRSKSEIFVHSQTDLFALRYAPDHWYNKALKQWQTVAYIDRSEAWAIYEPQVRQETDALMAAVERAEREPDPIRQYLLFSVIPANYMKAMDTLNFGVMLNPAKESAYAPIRTAYKNCKNRADEARTRAKIVITCENDYNNIVSTALSQVLSTKGFVVVQHAAGATNTCAAQVILDAPGKSGDIVTFRPTVDVELAGTGGTVFSFSRGVRGTDYSEQGARRTAYTNIAKEIHASFFTEFLKQRG